MVRFVAKWLPWLLLAPALLPLVYLDGLLYPYVAPKTLLFRALGIVLLAAFAYLALSGNKFYFERLKQKISWIPAALLLVAYTTSILGTDFYHSFWSVFDRGDGLLTLSVAVLFFYVILLSADKIFLRRLFAIAAWVGSAAALYVVLQWVQVASGVNLLYIEGTKGRLGGTLGNAAFLASYLGMTVWAGLATVREYRGMWRNVLYVGIALQFAAIIIAATRGTMLALLVVGLFTLLYLAWKGEGRTRTLARTAFVVGIALSALFFGFRQELKHAPFEPVRRIASVSLQDPTVSSRLFIWDNVFRITLERPLAGFGAEHIDSLFDRVYDPGSILEQWFDRTHNAYLDYFVQFGVLGLLLYAGLIGSLVYIGLTLFRRGDPVRGEASNGASKYGAMLLLLACVYAIQNFFVFDTAMTLWFLLAVLAAAFAYESPAPPSSLRISLPRRASLAVAVVTLALLYPVAIQPLRANLLLAAGYTDHVANVDRAIVELEQGLALGTYADMEYGYQAYSMYTDHQQTMLEGQQRVAAYRYALQTLSKNFDRYPYDTRTTVYLAHVLDSAPPEESVDEALLRQVLARAIDLSPKRAQPHYITSNISLKKGDKATDPTLRNNHYREAIVVLAGYARQVPDLAEPRFIIASLYVVVGDSVAAKSWADEGLALYKGGKDTARRAVRYYLAVEDWTQVRRFLSDIVATDPTDYPTLYDLAKAEFLTDNRDRALQIVATIRIQSPGLVETDPVFLKAIGQ